MTDRGASSLVMYMNSEPGYLIHCYLFNQVILDDTKHKCQSARRSSKALPVADAPRLLTWLDPLLRVTPHPMDRVRRRRGNATGCKSKG
ncbi:hypothetical protein E4U56_003594 [Claviceps arundinis]|uniref:Uncharacterized protein n=1 Tax=Claviceps arundinis TaxID=1623583 RepID=A0A9P7MPV6_9HYPO|nr:hypothetical protein E4U56_003594 [Claviceps arundinis]